MKAVGNPTPLCKRLRKRADKPHLHLNKTLSGEHFLFAAQVKTPAYLMPLALLFAATRTPGRYCTPGEAARAWHSYKGRQP